MSDLTFTEAFETYGATLRSPRSDFSAIAENGSLVMSCWQHYFSIPEKGILRYSDRLSRMRGKAGKLPGKNLLIVHLDQAYREKMPVRLVIASTNQTAIVDAGQDASRLKKHSM